jgi:hypothetical protein
MDTDDKEDEIGTVPPTNLLKCLNKDLSMNILKLSMYRHPMYVKKVQPDNETSIIDKMIDDA